MKLMIQGWSVYIRSTRRIEVHQSGKKMIHVDIGGHPLIPTGSKQCSGNLLFLVVFWFLNFQGDFDGLNEGFSGLGTSMIA
jgi:hypothetical protein